MRYRITYDNGTIVVTDARDSHEAKEIADKTYPKSKYHAVKTIITLRRIGFAK